MPQLVDTLCALNPDIIIHSGAKRARALAEPLASRLGLVCAEQPLWLERDFGEWESQSWQRIWRKTGNAMDGMLSDPAGFKPGVTGETTVELVRRTLAALRQLDDHKRTAIVSHGGPIAAARMLIGKHSFDDLPQLIIPTGSYVQIEGEALTKILDTPCIGLCKLDRSGENCIGCLRTRDEIGLWSTLHRNERLRVIAALDDRKNVFL